MKLLRVTLDKVRNLADGVYDLAHATGTPHDIVLITGPTASGKTTFLEVIALAKELYAPYGSVPDPRPFLRQGEPNGRVELTLALSDQERELAGMDDPIALLEVRLAGSPPWEPNAKLVELLSRYSHDSEHGKFAYFPANRRLDPAWELGQEPPPNEAAEGRLRLSKDPRKYRGVGSWLRAGLVGDALTADAQLRASGMVVASQASGALAEFRDAIATLCPSLRLGGSLADASLSHADAIWFERRDGRRSFLGELSAAEQDAVLLCATFCRVGLAHSVALIDRPDLHKDDAVVWLRALRGLAPDNQLIAAVNHVTESEGAHVIELPNG